jgi:hypothetical protein
VVGHAGIFQGRRRPCFFQAASKFKSRYAMFGFSDKANLDDGSMWPTYYAFKRLKNAEGARIAALV